MPETTTPTVTILPMGAAHGTGYNNPSAHATNYNSQHEHDLEPGERLVRGERALWRSVLIQALQDAIRERGNRYVMHDRTTSRIWLRLNNPDFRTVCEYAGYDPHTIYEKYQRTVKRCL
jgi:hypothetical protein